MSDPIEVGASVLRRHGATAVYVFGSRARGTARSDSDVDLAAWGIPGNKYWEVYADLQDEVSVGAHLVLLEDGSPFAKHILEKIERGWAKRVA